MAIVVSCTATKSLRPDVEAQVRSLPDNPDRLDEWARRLTRQGTKRRLRDLYAGPMWRSALDLESQARALGFDVGLWVASAGLGLAPACREAPAYEASFSPGPDQVAGDPVERRAWWQGLRHVSIAGARGRHLREVRDTADQVLLALSPVYLEGLTEELEQLSDDDGVAVMTSVPASTKYPLSSRGLRQRLRGTQMTLNARAAAKYLELVGNSRLGSQEGHELWSAWARTNRLPEPTARPRLDDDEVRSFIRTSVQNRPTSRTRLLGELRRSGLACEQERFARLYTEIQEGL